MSEKHMEAARRALGFGDCAPESTAWKNVADKVSAALAASEREGMKRAAEIAQSRFTIDTVRKNSKGTPYQSGSAAIYAAKCIADAIFSEARDIWP